MDRRITSCLVRNLALVFLFTSCGEDTFEIESPNNPNDAAETGTDAIDAGTPSEDTDSCPFTPVPSPDDPCTILTCDDAGEPIFVPVEVGTPCVATDCCLANSTTCQPCEDDTCANSGLTCTGPPIVQCPDDGNTCTTPIPECKDELCTCRYDALSDGTECKADAQACTEGDTCVEGVCVAGAPTDLTNDNPCIDLVCVKGTVEEKLLSGDCSDGDPCTEGDYCALGQCIPQKLVECPIETCFSANACDPDTGTCKPELKAVGATCEVSNECVLLATCDEAGECVPQNVLDCDDQNDCTFDTCDPEATDPSDQCGHQILGDNTQCGSAGYCDAGLCKEPETNDPPTKPIVSVAPANPSPEDSLECLIVGASVDPEGYDITYEFLWLQNGAPSPYIGNILPAEATSACDVWKCIVTPKAGDQAGPAGEDEVQVGAGDGGSSELGPDYKVHSFPPLGGSWGYCAPGSFVCTEGFGSGEAVGVKITFKEDDLPYTIGSIRGLVPAGQSWRGGIWQDACGVHPCTVEVASGANVVGQGTTQMAESVLANPYTVTTTTIWVGFVSLSGDFINAAGPMYFDGDGKQGENRILGSNLGGSVSWNYASVFGSVNGDWIVEIGAGQGGSCN